MSRDFCPILMLLAPNFFDSIYVLSIIHATCQILYQKFDKIMKKQSIERVLSVKPNCKKIGKNF